MGPCGSCGSVWVMWVRVGHVVALLKLRQSQDKLPQSVDKLRQSLDKLCQKHTHDAQPFPFGDTQPRRSPACEAQSMRSLTQCMLVRRTCPATHAEPRTCMAELHLICCRKARQSHGMVGSEDPPSVISEGCFANRCFFSYNGFMQLLI
jgi:hypothetical protein